MRYGEELGWALAAVDAAGEAVMRWFRTELKVTHKSADQPLTEADLEADRILRAMLLDSGPGYGWLSEETADSAARLTCERVWIVDPIDGTRSFISGRAEFALSVGLAERGEAVVGVVSNPAAGEVYWSVRGGGAWVRREGVDVRLQVSDVAPTVLASRSELAAGEFEGLSEWQPVPLGSTAYKLAGVASGRGGAFVSRGPKNEWDVCAGVLLVEEAGGAATDLTGARIRYNRPDPRVRGIVAGTPSLHGRLLAQIATLPPTGRMAEWS